MYELYDIELEPEVEAWLETLSKTDFAKIDQLVGMLAERAETLDEPHSRHLGGGLRELRRELEHESVRITYWLAPGRRVVLLTAFTKTQRRQQADIDRARALMEECKSYHGVAGREFHPRYALNPKQER
jgi:hypothetical protein